MGGGMLRPVVLKAVAVPRRVVCLRLAVMAVLLAAVGLAGTAHALPRGVEEEREALHAEVRGLHERYGELLRAGDTEGARSLKDEMEVSMQKYRDRMFSLTERGALERMQERRERFGEEDVEMLSSWAGGEDDDAREGADAWRTRRERRRDRMREGVYDPEDVEMDMGVRERAARQAVEQEVREHHARLEKRTQEVEADMRRRAEAGVERRMEALMRRIENSDLSAEQELALRKQADEYREAELRAIELKDEERRQRMERRRAHMDQIRALTEDTSMDAIEQFEASLAAEHDEVLSNHRQVRQQLRDMRIKIEDKLRTIELEREDRIVREDLQRLHTDL